MTGKPKCGWRWVVVDANGKTVTVWAWLSEAISSCRLSGKSGWTVQHEGTRQVVLRIRE